MDPLQLLREYTIKKKDIVELPDGDGVVFGDQLSSKSAVTNFKGMRGFLTVGQILFLLQNVGLSHGQYSLQARKNNVQPIALPDRNELLSFLQGRTQTSEKIDATMPIALTTRAPSREEPPAKRRKEDTSMTTEEEKQKQVEEQEKRFVRNVLRREILHEDRISVLKAKNNKTFESVIKMLQDMKKGSSKGDKQAPHAQPTHSYGRYEQPGQKIDVGSFNVEFRNPVSKSAAKPKSTTDKPRKRTSRTPIIVVPGGTGSLLTLFNIKKFIEGQQFEPPLKAMERGEAKPQQVYLTRKKGNTTVNYKVIDNFSQLRGDDWKRVVAVFVAGPEWQFKSFPPELGNDPTEILAKVQGFHLKYAGHKLHPNVANWSVVVLEIMESQRHMDATAVFKFWQTVDRWCQKEHANLKF